MTTGRYDLEDVDLSIDGYRELPSEDGFVEELVAGRLVREPIPGAEHGALVLNIGGMLREFVGPRNLGKVLVECGFILADEPPTVRGPDVAFVRWERLPERRVPRSFIHGAPDLAIEVASPSNRHAEMLAKVRDYLRGGSRLVWVVDPASRTVTSYATGGEARILTDGDVLTGAKVLPGFSVPVAKLLEV